MIYLTSDFHIDHWNIVKYVGRPFKTLEKMNETIIKRFNERVKPDDTTIYVGDFAFKHSSESPEGGKTPNRYEGLLNGKIIFIRGNHDGNNGINTPIKSMVIELGGQTMWVTHANANPLYKINLCGHVHEKWKLKRMDGFKETVLINVGVDVNQFYPVTINEILRDYSRFIKSERGANV